MCESQDQQWKTYIQTSQTWPFFGLLAISDQDKIINFLHLNFVKICMY